MRISLSFVSRLSLLGLLVLFLVACGSTGANTNTASTNNKKAAQGGTKSTPIAVPGQITEFKLPAPIGGLNGITAGSDGNLWFTDQTATGETGVGRITLTGQTRVVTTFQSQDRPLAIVTGPDDNVWFTTLAGELGRITIAPTAKFKFTGFSGGSGFYAINGITTGPDGNLWFTRDTAIMRITPKGTVTPFPLSATSSPNQITAGPDGNLWFTENAAIGRITPTGTVTEFALPTNHSSPNGITAGPDGNLWFTQEETDQIGRITPTGSVTEFTLPGFISPLEITAGPDGNLWFTDQDKAAIGRITPTGTITTFALHAPAGNVTIGPDKNLWFTGGTTAGTGIGYITL